ncbi:hypothetical protein VDG1235_3333 [Verrucomicrobiia bacterium DG1235]|nr:hypothetical protein VDG1235_3333 [Verrucomicrobiae bacterium DG1235]
MRRTKQLLSQRASARKEEIFNAVCEDAAEDLDADLVSIWTFDSDLSQIECQSRFDAIDNSYSKGLLLKRSEYPNYFRAIVEDNLVNAPNARIQNATKEFTDSYFIPNGIRSLLDFILHKDFTPIGIICCENRRSIRHWSAEDENYLRTIATLTSFLFEPTL